MRFITLKNAKENGNLVHINVDSIDAIYTLSNPKVKNEPDWSSAIVINGESIVVVESVDEILKKINNRRGPTDKKLYCHFCDSPLTDYAEPVNYSWDD